MSRQMLIGGLVLLLAVVIAVSVVTKKQTPPQAVSPPMPAGDVFIQLMKVPSFSEFPKITENLPLTFPQDHGPHLKSRLEWWYYTGNLETHSGRHFGYQLTFFRMALTPEPTERESSWATNQMYMAHFALTDVDNKRFAAFERRSRGAAGLAGANASPFEVWVENWSAIDGSQLPRIRPGIAQAEGALTYLSATEDDIAINLILKPGKPIVLGGDRGKVRKSAEPSMTSYYYSQTRMPTTGTILLGTETFAVKGLSWLDREWGNALLGADQVGWSWFALQLSDQREVMFYQLRERDGKASKFSRGVLVSDDGSSRPLTLDEVEIQIQDYWRSPFSHARYPSRWQMQIEDEHLTLHIEPYLPNQELSLSMGQYWEGAVKVSGTSKGEPVGGSGYVELTGFLGE